MSDRDNSIAPTRKRKQILCHKSQKTFAIWVGMVLFLYSVFLFVLAFTGPYIYHALKLVIPLSIEEQGQAATHMLSLVQNFWPVLLGTFGKIWPLLLLAIFMAAFFSLYMTHKFSGPVYRLEESAKQIVEGTLSLRIKLRDGDHLQELAALVNQSIIKLDEALIEIRNRNRMAEETLHALTEQQGTKPTDETQQHVAAIQTALQECQAIKKVLGKFSLSDS